MPPVLRDLDLGDDVIEIGPGPGFTTEVLRRRSARITAVELDEGLAARLAERLAGTNVEVVDRDATDTGLDSDRFTGAASFNMLHHVPTAEAQDAIFAELARVHAARWAPRRGRRGLQRGDRGVPRRRHVQPDRPRRARRRGSRAAGFAEIEVDTLRVRLDVHRPRDLKRVRVPGPMDRYRYQSPDFVHWTVTSSRARQSTGWRTMDDRERLRRQLAFVLEADALKSVERRNYLADGSRRENTAEHSWHLALMATVLAEHASEPVDVGRVIVMLLVHDLVEIHAGDTFVYDDAAHADKAEREMDAACRLFGQLPADQGAGLRGLWEEFEERQTPDARFAASLDRLSPLLLNHASGGITWAEHGIAADRVRAVNRRIEEGSPALWDHAAALIADAVDRGFLAEH